MQSLDTASRREAARSKTTGEFGHQSRTAPDTPDVTTVISMAQQAVRRELRASYTSDGRSSLDVDDLVQEVCAEYYAALAKRRADYAVTDGVHVPAPIQSPKGFVTVIARRTIARIATPAATSSREWAARERFFARLAEITETEQRDVSQNEWHAIAHEVRMSFPPGLRPHPRYYMGSIEDVSEPIDENMALADHRLVNDDEFDSGSVADRALDMAESGRLADARKLAYDAIAEHRGLPVGRHGEITERRAGNARRAVEARGGVAGTMRAYVADPKAFTSKEVEAIFGPFTRSEEPDARQQIAEAFVALDLHAPMLYDAAVQSATIARVRARR